ncbi:putative F-box domain-containing protein [Arabidopsis thaliana]|uniref:F-box domain-containing protein n=2 Tax=Arabidopsis TaxID=3701 RepID=A0A178WEF1_ARATH|nr:F-box domain [Arabidopsis thaliana x Arabidopsis arenosa]OAP16034.1 hypothetical protein AXX17_AT1G51580 [Arabidopsis thaliana]OAP16800.1 hypothetical protein AXX17_AT1G51610 [Arabidopsis thaliana]
MDTLPHHLLDEILFRIDHRSLAMIQCTNRSLQSHISKNPNFASEYFSRVRSSLLYIAFNGSPLLCYHLYGDSRSPRTVEALTECHILGYCSGLLLLFLNKNLCVANPLTKKFRFLNHSRSKFFPWVTTLRRGRQQVIGFSVDQIDRTTNSLKIVIINEVRNSNETTYEFEINVGYSWKLSETTLTCCTSNLDDRMKKPVYMKGGLHWLRNDGSIVAFNPETEKARLISIRFPKELCSKTLFTAADNNLILISATEEVFYVYAVENILTDPKWVVLKQIRNGVLDEKMLYSWYSEAYDGKCLVLREILKKDHYKQVLHGYDLRANKWEVIGSIPGWYTSALDFYQFTPSLSSVIGLDAKEEEEILACDHKKISSINSIIRMLDGISS